MSTKNVSINTLTGQAVDRLIENAARLRVQVSKGSAGETIIDAGKTARGGIEAGLAIAEICLGGLGHVSLAPTGSASKWPYELCVRSADPVIACLASQYAGWALSHGEGKSAFFALGSGPGRALARKEPLFSELEYHDSASRATLVLESDRPPPPEITEKVARDCGVNPQNVTFIYAPTQSLAGSVQVVARVLEVALHKAHELSFPLSRVIDGMASAPLAPPHPDFIRAMGRTNDAIIYGGTVQLFVTGPASDAHDLAEKLPSLESKDYGHAFADIFKAYKGDFYSIDPMLFSPARVLVTAVESGETYQRGRLNYALLDVSFG